MINWTLKTLPIKDLKPHPKNPRQISKQQVQHLEDLIAKFGLIDKPIVNTDNMIIGGHQRVKILKKQKIKEVECWVPDHLLDEKEVEHLMLGVNKIQGKFDWDILANEFEPLDLLAWGFTEEELFDSSEKSEKTAEEKSEKIAEESQKDEKTKANMCPACGYEY